MADYNKSGVLPITATFVAEESPNNPLATHAWSVNGGTVEQTGNTFTRIFTAYGDYTVTHSGTGTCGSIPCSSVTKSISITATPDIVGLITYYATIPVLLTSAMIGLSYFKVIK